VSFSFKLATSTVCGLALGGLVPWSVFTFASAFAPEVGAGVASVLPFGGGALEADSPLVPVVLSVGFAGASSSLTSSAVSEAPPSDFAVSPAGFAGPLGASSPRFYASSIDKWLRVVSILTERDMKSVEFGLPGVRSCKIRQITVNLLGIAPGVGWCGYPRLSKLEQRIKCGFSESAWWMVQRNRVCI
jgi:hypothetical protein